ncbi:hypothetical protein [Paractinoplanes maris]|uniref:hypothetical protein n=1 Tax=Paractinoplanes maris TaxID=1734446 RepID=UPI002020D66B|nr:hypothetical protein [Actinoplanes maris]
MPRIELAVRRDADKRKTYAMEAACADGDRTKTLGYAVKVDRQPFLRGQITCDGEVEEVRISGFLRGEVVVDLEGGPVETAYAIVTPRSEG